jgi:hypothetical protein
VYPACGAADGGTAGSGTAAAGQATAGQARGRLARGCLARGCLARGCLARGCLARGCLARGEGGIDIAAHNAPGRARTRDASRVDPAFPEHAPGQRAGEQPAGGRRFGPAQRRFPWRRGGVHRRRLVHGRGDLGIRFARSDQDRDRRADRCRRPWPGQLPTQDPVSLGREFDERLFGLDLRQHLAREEGLPLLHEPGGDDCLRRVGHDLRHAQDRRHVSSSRRGRRGPAGDPRPLPRSRRWPRVRGPSRCSGMLRRR